jgi:hypothetical protein
VAHHPGADEGRVEPRVADHLHDGRDAAPLLADPLGEGIVIFDLGRSVRAVAELVLETLDEDAVARAVRRAARNQEAGETSSRLRQGQERVRHGRRAEPFVAGEAIAAVRLVGPRRVGAHIRPALLLGHGHADRRAALLSDGDGARVIAPGEDPGLEAAGEAGRMPESRD